MGALFSKGAAKNKITSQDKAILDLKVQRDNLKQYQKKIQVVVERETQIAKNWLQKNDKSKALLALRKKKYQESMLTKTDAQLMNLEQLVSSIEYAQVEKQVLDGLMQGNQVLKTLQSEMKLEDVEKLMEETAEAIDYQNQVSELLAGKLTTEDEDDVLAELDQIVKEQEVKESKVKPEDFPAVPKETVIPDKTKNEEQEAEEEDEEKQEAIPA